MDWLLSIALPAGTVLFVGSAIFASLWALFSPKTKPAPAQLKAVAIQQPVPFQAQVAALQPAAPRIALSAVLSADNLLIVGPKGSGKTTLIRSLIAQRKGTHIALDPHSAPGKWPCAVVGGGRDYHAIDLMFDRLHSDMDARFKDLARGAAKEGQFPRRTVVGDEFRSIVKEIDQLNKQRDKEERGVGASQRLLARISEGRKVGECALIAAHADTVKALGIEGEGDLRMCFDWIVYLGALAVKRVAEAEGMARPAVAYHTDRDRFYLLDFDIPIVREGEQLSGVSEDDDLSVFLPLRRRVASGAAFARTGSGDSGAAVSTPSTGTPNQYESGTPDTDAPAPGTDDFLIYELVRRGKSANQVHEIVGGTRSTVLDKVRKYKETLDRVLESV